jgi:hypothetical protein
LKLCPEVFNCDESSFINQKYKTLPAKCHELCLQRAMLSLVFCPPIKKTLQEKTTSRTGKQTLQEKTAVEWCTESGEDRDQEEETGKGHAHSL